MRYRQSAILFEGLGDFEGQIRSIAMHGSMLAVLSRLLAVSAASLLAWITYQLTVICRRGAVLARQFRGPPVRHMMTGATAMPPLSQLAF